MNRKIGVLMVTGVYYPEINGAVMQCMRVISQLNNKVSFSVLTSTNNYHLKRLDCVNGVSVYRASSKNNIVSRIVLILKILYFFIRNNHTFNIVHLHGFSSKSALIILLSVLFNKKIILKMTSLGHDDPVSIKNKNKVLFYFYSLADTNIGISPIFREKYNYVNMDINNYRQVSNGVLTDLFSPVDSNKNKRDLRKKYNLPVDMALILFVGHFSVEKAPECLLDAWLNKIYEMYPDSGLVFIGNTDATNFEIDANVVNRIGQKSRKFLNKRIFFVEKTYRIQDYYKLSDIFVLTSLREGMPNALLEAMSCGLPVISSKLKGITDLIIDHGHNGFLYNIDEHEALNKKLILLLKSSKTRRKVGINARNTICNNYNVVHTSINILDIYNKLSNR